MLHRQPICDHNGPRVEAARVLASRPTCCWREHSATTPHAALQSNNRPWMQHCSTCKKWRSSLQSHGGTSVGARHRPQARRGDAEDGATRSAPKHCPRPTENKTKAGGQGATSHCSLHRDAEVQSSHSYWALTRLTHDSSQSKSLEVERGREMYPCSLALTGPDTRGNTRAPMLGKPGQAAVGTATRTDCRRTHVGGGGMARGSNTQC